MKKAVLLFCTLSTSYISFSQPEKYKCPCSEIGLDSVWADSSRVSCYLIPVPKTTSNTTNGKLKLAVAVVSSAKRAKEQPLLYLHGGPGIATLENVPRYLKSETWKSMLEDRSLIFFDYRGTGFSAPQLCPELKDSLALFAKTKPSGEAIQVYKNGLYKKCRGQLHANGIDVSSFNSAQLAADADAIRKALKIKNWNVYGVSFGTTVALNMLRNDDRHIKSVILDSPFPPNAPWLDFIRPFDTCFKVLERNIANDPVASIRFPSLREDFKKAVARLNRQPATIKNSTAPEPFEFNGDNFAWSVWSAMLNPRSIPFVPLAIQEVGNDNDSILSKWLEAFHNPDAFGAFSEPQSFAVICFESRPRSVADTKASLVSNYPDFASFYVDFEGELCNAWQPESAGPGVFQPVISNTPTLILSGEYDPVCPPLFADITAGSLSKSTSIVVPAASHAAIHADDCLRKLAGDFISNPGKKVDLKCVSERQRIKFINEDLEKALVDFKNRAK